MTRGDELDRTVDLAGQGPGGAAQMAHQGGRVAVVAGDVADHEPDPAAREGDQVVEVAADLEPFGRREVAGVSTVRPGTAGSQRGRRLDWRMWDVR